ncbi:MAG: IspD/TarI family cytidylyltransferase [Planctomycetia bacterium]|nr:IspD/TarI family cytidylyltransferase [Planctomycetia bacterium]
MPRFAVIIAAAGSSRRFVESTTRQEYGESEKKIFRTLNGVELWRVSLELFAKRADVVQIVLVVAPEDRRRMQETVDALALRPKVTLVLGGAERFLSVENALAALDHDVDFIAVHDAARPCVSNHDVERVFADAAQFRAAILATPIVGSLKRSVRDQNDSVIVDASVARENLWEAQTPQVFERKLLEDAYRLRDRSSVPTDDCALVQALGVPVHVTPGSRMNIKITYREDLDIAKKFLEISRD